MLFSMRLLPLALLLLLAAPPAHTTLVPRAFDTAHRAALRHSRGLARDLRTAFRAVLVEPRGASAGPHRVYCIAAPQTPMGTPVAGGFPAANGTSAAPSAATSAAGKPSGTGKPATTAGAPPSASTGTVPTSPWKLIDSYAGSSFFNGWDFFTQPDPTNGIVQFIDQNTATNAGLLEVNAAGNAVMRVETTPTVANTRQSIRITTQASYNGGLVIMDSVHMPTGCGTWPAFWSNGPNWPAGGEIDIVEGVNDYTNNQATIHTNQGCTLPSASASALNITGSVVGGTDCSALDTGNQGCGIRASTGNSFGAGFNDNGGGVYTMQWGPAGIAIHFFPSGAVPADITAGAPQPGSWGAPVAAWPAATCDPFKFFSSHSVIFDTTLCGDWASGVWAQAGLPGQAQSCAQRTGFPTCEAFVRASGAAFAEAYWEVRSVKIYQTS